MRWIPVILPNGSLNVYAVLDGRTATADLGKIEAFAASSNIRTRPMEMEEDDK